MYFTSAIIALTFAIARATPVDVPNSALNLDNGEMTVSTGQGPTSPLQVRGKPNNCSGSHYCSNEQSRKDDAAAAVAKVQQTTYRNGGDKAGVCHGHVGLFVQGKDPTKHDCTASGQDLTDAYSSILNQGCQVCGWITTPQGGDCKIKMDYISHC